MRNAVGYLFLLFGLCGAVTVCQAQFPPPAVDFAPSTGGVVTVPVRNGLDMPVSLNGEPPVDVLFDTGAGTLLSTNLARRLGLKLNGNLVLGGFGSGGHTAATAVVDTVQIGGLTLHGVTFLVVDPPIAGSDEFAVLGVPLLSQVVTKVDYVRHQITFTDPEQFHYSGVAPPGTAAMSEAVGLDAFERPVGTTLKLKVRNSRSVGNVALKLREIL